MSWREAVKVFTDRPSSNQRVCKNLSRADCDRVRTIDMVGRFKRAKIRGLRMTGEFKRYILHYISKFWIHYVASSPRVALPYGCRYRVDVVIRSGAASTDYRTCRCKPDRGISGDCLPF